MNSSAGLANSFYPDHSILFCGFRITSEMLPVAAGHRGKPWSRPWRDSRVWIVGRLDSRGAPVDATATRCWAGVQWALTRREKTRCDAGCFCICSRCPVQSRRRPPAREDPRPAEAATLGPSHPCPRLTPRRKRGLASSARRAGAWWGDWRDGAVRTHALRPRRPGPEPGAESNREGGEPRTGFLRARRRARGRALRRGGEPGLEHPVVQVASERVFKCVRNTQTIRRAAHAARPPALSGYPRIRLGAASCSRPIGDAGGAACCSESQRRAEGSSMLPEFNSQTPGEQRAAPFSSDGRNPSRMLIAERLVPAAAVSTLG